MASETHFNISFKFGWLAVLSSINIVEHEFDFFIFLAYYFLYVYLVNTLYVYGVFSLASLKVVINKLTNQCNQQKRITFYYYYYYYLPRIASSVLIALLSMRVLRSRSWLYSKLPFFTPLNQTTPKESSSVRIPCGFELTSFGKFRL